MIAKLTIAVIEEEAYKLKTHLEGLGIDSNVNDEDINYITIWANTDNISYIEESKDGYVITMVDGSSFLSKSNPFLDTAE